jgi:hypothetical protein
MSSSFLLPVVVLPFQWKKEGIEKGDCELLLLLLVAGKNR